MSIDFSKYRQDWGIVSGTLIALVALLAPVYLLGPIFGQIFPWLPVDINIKISIATVIIELCAIGIIAAALAAYSKTFRDIGFTQLRPVHALWTLGGFVVYFCVSLAIQTAAHGLVDQNQAQNLGYQNLGGLDKALAFVPLVVLTPLAEETIFRGFLFRGFRKYLPFWLAALGASALFGLAHGQWNVGLDVFAMSLVGCYLVERTKSIWPSIFLHALKNSVAFWLLYIYNGG